VTEDDIQIHDETNRTLGVMLAAMDQPAFPVAVGVIYCDPRPSYEGAVWAQNEQAKGRLDGRKPTIDQLLRGGHTWTVN